MAAKHTVIVIATATVVIAGLIGVSAVVQRTKKAAAPAPSAGAGPVEYVDFEAPMQAIGFVNGQKGARREQALASVVGKHIPDTGWEGTVTAITSESGGRVALRMQYLSSSVIGGEYWVVALVGKDHGAKEGDFVKVTGRIKDVLQKAGAGSVVQSVILEEAKIVK